MRAGAVLENLIDDMARGLIKAGVFLHDDQAIDDLLQGVRINGKPATEIRQPIIVHAARLTVSNQKVRLGQRLSPDEFVESVRELRMLGLDQVRIATILGVGPRKVSPHVKDLPIRRGPKGSDPLTATPEKLRIAYEQWQAGAKLAIIADGLGVGVRRVKELCGHLPRGERHTAPGWLGRAQELWIAGIKTEAIAAECGTSASMIRRHCGHLPRGVANHSLPVWIQVTQQQWMDGVLIADIAAHVGKDEKVIRQHCEQLPRGDTTPKWVAPARELWQANVSAEKIALRFGVSPTAVYYRCGHLPRGSKAKPPPAWVEAASQRWIAGVKLPMIASEFKVSKPTICRYCRHLPRPKANGLALG